MKDLIQNKSLMMTHKRKVKFYKKDREFEIESMEHIQTKDNEIISNTIIQHLKGGDDESDILEFKPYIHDKIRIVRLNFLKKTREFCLITFSPQDDWRI